MVFRRYDISAVSKPHHWGAWVLFPYVRLLQWRFRQDTCKKMCDLVAASRGGASSAWDLKQSQPAAAA